MNKLNNELTVYIYLENTAREETPPPLSIYPGMMVESILTFNALLLGVHYKLQILG